MKSTIIFDLDGTLVDSSAGIIASLDSAFTAISLEPELPLIPSLIGPPLRETLLLLSPKSNLMLIDQLTAAFKDHYDSTGFQQTHPFPGVTEMLQELTASGLTLHIATNKRQQPTAKILEALDWNHFFDKVLSPDSFSPPLLRKAGVLAQLINDANIKARDCLYLGDRLDDYHAAQENNISFVLAEWGFEGNGTVLSNETIRFRSPSPYHFLNLIKDAANS